MNPFIQDYKIKKGFLWAGLAAMTAPLAMIPIVMTGLDIVTEKAQLHWSKYFKSNTPSPPVPPALAPQWLSEKSLLSVMAYEMGKKEGVLSRGVTMLSLDHGLHNASVNSSGKNFVIHFEGNPLKEKNGINIAKGVIGHEIGHLSTSGHHNFKKIAMMTSSTYGVLAGLSVFSAWADPIKLSAMTLPDPVLSLLADKPLLMGAATVFAAAAYAIPRMARSFMHSTEYIADLRGGEIAGPENMIETLETVQRRNTPPKPSGLKAAWQKATNIIDLPYTETHPSHESRIDLLKKAFNIETPPVQPEHHPVKVPTPPALS